MKPDTLNKIMDEERMTNFSLSIKALISPADISQIRNGKKPCFPAWRKRIAKALCIKEAEIFPEYEEKEANAKDE